MHPALQILLSFAHRLACEGGVPCEAPRVVAIDALPGTSVRLALAAAEFAAGPAEAVARDARATAVRWLEGAVSSEDVAWWARHLDRVVPLTAAALAGREGGRVAVVAQLAGMPGGLAGEIGDWRPPECGDWAALRMLLSLNATRSAMSAVALLAAEGPLSAYTGEEAAERARQAAMSAGLSVDARARDLNVPVRPLVVELIDAMCGGIDGTSA